MSSLQGHLTKDTAGVVRGFLDEGPYVTIRGSSFPVNRLDEGLAAEAIAQLNEAELNELLAEILVALAGEATAKMSSAMELQKYYLASFLHTWSFMRGMYSAAKKHDFRLRIQIIDMTSDANAELLGAASVFVPHIGAFIKGRNTAALLRLASDNESNSATQDMFNAVSLEIHEYAFWNAREEDIFRCAKRTTYLYAIQHAVPIFQEISERTREELEHREFKLDPKQDFFAFDWNNGRKQKLLLPMIRVLDFVQDKVQARLKEVSADKTKARDLEELTAVQANTSVRSYLTRPFRNAYHTLRSAWVKRKGIRP